MRILFYTGYHKYRWNTNNQIGIGGSEVAVIKVAESLVKFGWNVTVGGYVEEGNINRVEWLPLEKVHQKYYDQFDVIVGVSYIHFALEFSEYSAKKLFWVHNTDFHPWHRGEMISDPEHLLAPDYIDGIICLTNWHKQQWSQTYSIDPERVTVIGNGIDSSSFIGHPPRVKGRFIWSSAPERGLSELLDNWQSIREVMPHATLRIYSPGYSIATPEVWGRDGLEGVEFMGTVGQRELHYAMLESEYWPYLTSYEETYCITALEMQYAKVLPITTQVAALKETVHSGIKLDYNETVFHLAIELLKMSSPELKNKSVEAAYKWAKMQTWSARALEWHNFVTQLVNDR